MEIKFKRLNKEATVPYRANPTDAGMDLTAVSVTKTGNYIEYDTGIAMAIPEGYVGLLFPRSSVTNKDLMLKNSVGVVDSSYRGPIKARFYHTDVNPTFDSLVSPNIYKVGERVAQLVVVPIALPTVREVDDLDNTSRSTGGFGSSGV